MTALRARGFSIVFAHLMPTFLRVGPQSPTHNTTLVDHRSASWARGQGSALTASAEQAATDNARHCTGVIPVGLAPTSGAKAHIS
jgi:hypothetical protein